MVSTYDIKIVTARRPRDQSKIKGGNHEFCALPFLSFDWFLMAHKLDYRNAWTPGYMLQNRLDNMQRSFQVTACFGVTAFDLPLISRPFLQFAVANYHCEWIP